MKSATKIFTTAYGTIMALAGIEHGIGEILQGNVIPDNIMIFSWPNSAFFRAVSGEPAMTIIPNMLVTGILAVLVSLALLIWVHLFIHRRYGGLIMILISILMLLMGGGIFPPFFTILIAFVSFAINSRWVGWRTHLSSSFRRFLARLWPWSFGIGILSWFAMLPGVGILDYFFGIYSEIIIWIIFGCMAGFLVLTVLTGFARDSLQINESAT